MTNVKDIGQHLKEYGIKPSYQRLKIMEFLLGTKSHPTVESIHTVLVEEIPTLSKTTVYNTLKLFIEKKIVLVVNIEDNETRFDADTSLHGHFKCNKCGVVSDFFFDTEKFDFNDNKKCKIEETHIYQKGICDKCMNS